MLAAKAVVAANAADRRQNDEGQPKKNQPSPLIEDARAVVQAVQTFIERGIVNGDEEKMHDDNKNLVSLSIVTNCGIAQQVTINSKLLTANIEPDIRQKIARLSKEDMPKFRELHLLSMRIIHDKKPHIPQLICSVEKIDLRNFETSRVLRQCVYYQIKK